MRAVRTSAVGVAVSLVVLVVAAPSPAAAAYSPAPVGTYKPGSSTTGYAPYGITLTKYTNQFGPIVNGALTIDTPNTTISGYDIPARVVVRAANVTITKSRITGGATPLSGDEGLVECIAATAKNVTISDSQLRPDSASFYWNGIRGHDFTALRNDIYDVVDGIDTYGATAGATLNVSIQANYVHGLSGFGPDSMNRSYTHNDGVQLSGGTGVTIRGNYLSAHLGSKSMNLAASPLYPTDNANAAIQVNQSARYGPSRGVLIDTNWFDGGAATLNFDAGDAAVGNVGSVVNNKFARDSYEQGSEGNKGKYGAGGDLSVTFRSTHGLYFTKPSTAPSASGGAVPDPDGGNTYEDNGHRITVRVYSGAAS